jgi:hypothetical protein
MRIKGSILIDNIVNFLYNPLNPPIGPYWGK